MKKDPRRMKTSPREVDRSGGDDEASVFGVPFKLSLHFRLGEMALYIVFKAVRTDGFRVFKRARSG